ncbi:MAG: outer membrane protein assembly factor BamE [Gammaproteobacteria bacterium]|nr:outer membrane protein assembly factor BamE [Gammaproteobacteria bacterium]
MKRISLLALAACGLLLSACGSKVNEANFDKVKEGMVKEEVRAILGEPDQSDSGSFAGLSGASQVWESEEATISVQYFNDKVVAKNLTKKKD